MQLCLLVQKDIRKGFTDAIAGSTSSLRYGEGNLFTSTIRSSNFAICFILLSHHSYRFSLPFYYQSGMSNGGEVSNSV